MGLKNPIDSYYAYVVQQMLTLGATVQLGYNPDGSANIVAQPMCGYLAARDWPLTQPVEGGLYLLIQREVPIGGTRAQTKYRYYCQWSWLMIGTDVTQTQLAQNRASRLIANMQIEENLRQANYPGFCQVKAYTANQQTGVLTSTPVTSLYPVSQPETVTWSGLTFLPKLDNSQTGLLYGAAALELDAYSDVSILVA